MIRAHGLSKAALQRSGGCSEAQGKPSLPPGTARHHLLFDGSLLEIGNTWKINKGWRLWRGPSSGKMRNYIFTFDY